VFPLAAGPARSLASLTTPYTCLWEPSLSRDLTARDVADIAACLVDFCKTSATVRLDALDPAQPFHAALRAAARGRHLTPLGFDHFGNWHEPLPENTTWDTYLSLRPGSLREAIRRKSRRLFSQHAAKLQIIRSLENLETGIAAYEAIYAQSWKQPEPFPLFMPAFMREAARAGTLRLALLHADGRPIAAQLWTVHQGTATLMKLAHRRDADALSPGTVLTAEAIRHLLQNDAIADLDFGRGDDPYKKLWTTQRRQRTGLVLANPRTWRGARAAVKHWAGQWKRAASHWQRFAE
jgi:hypothetical protein